jgi:quercetin dioxygenase-like cupin family protein
MMHSRRNLGLLLAAVAADQAIGQPGKLGSKTYSYEDLPVRKNGSNAQRAILRGTLHTGFGIEMHETELAPGNAPHPPHHHVHEELIMIREGSMEVTIAGKTTMLGPGSVALVASNEEHGWRNTGETRARYFVLALGPGSA